MRGAGTARDARRMTARSALLRQMGAVRAARKQDVARLERHYQEQMERFAGAFDELGRKTVETNAAFLRDLHRARSSHLETMMRLRDSAVRSDDVALVRGIETSVSRMGDDAQLANLNLQNELQKQQQALQMISSVSKMLHDTAMAIIRKIG